MRIKAGVLFVLYLSSLIMLSKPLFASQDKEKTAIEAAEAWLSLVDEGWYLRSWSEGATYFKNAVSQGQPSENLLARPYRESSHLQGTQRPCLVLLMGNT